MPDPHQHLPLTPAAFHIVLALSAGDKHGYAIMQEVDALSGGQVNMGPGTLYGTIKRLLKAGLVAESHRRPTEAEDERRRYYTLTDLGRRVASAEARRLARLVQTAEQRLLLGGAE